jgi:hypothetical protein
MRRRFFFGVAAPIFRHQLSRQCGDNLLTISGALSLQDFGMNALANAPVQQGQSHVDGRSGLATAFFNQGFDVAQKRRWQRRRASRLAHAVTSPSRRTISISVLI